MTREQAKEILERHGITDKVVFLGYRSANSQYGQYNDVGALFTPTEYIEFKFNTLPSKWERDIAKLMPGVYRYKKGLHGVHHLGNNKEDKAIRSWLDANIGKDHSPVLVNGKPRILPYWAYRQAGPVTVLRHGATKTETIVDPAGWPFIDLHKGGWNLTSSEGCQTLYPEHWAEARALGYSEMDKYGQDHILYCLVQM